MEKRKYTLGERLNMVAGQKMTPNCKYHIKKMHDPRHVQAGSREFDSIIVECEEGFYFLRDSVNRRLKIPAARTIAGDPGQRMGFIISAGRRHIYVPVVASKDNFHAESTPL